MLQRTVQDTSPALGQQARFPVGRKKREPILPVAVQGPRRLEEAWTETAVLAAANGEKEP